MHLLDKLNSIKDLSSKDEIIKSLESLIPELLFSEHGEPYMKCYILLKQNDISKFDSCELSHCLNILDRSFPNCIDTPYHIFGAKNNADLALKIIISFFKRNYKGGLLGNVRNFIGLIGNNYAYPDDHFVSALIAAMNDNPTKLLNYKTTNHYENIIIKACKVRSLTAKTKVKYEGEDYIKLASEIIESQYYELVDYMDLSTDDFVAALKLQQKTNIKSMLENLSNDNRNIAIDIIIKNITPEEKCVLIKSFFTELSSDEKKNVLTNILKGDYFINIS